jgi:hypothetical protein
LYRLPWPVEALQDLGATDVALKVTLSYFIEPNLGDKTSVLPSKYRSCGLRFHMKRPDEPEPAFLGRLNELARDAEEIALPPEDDPDWHFGARSIAAGSLHCDIWSGSTAELARRDLIAVVPVGGWWKDLTRKKRFDSKIRYSLILSITTPDREALLYSSVQQKINIATPVEIQIVT